ncbi:hypothetical protein KOW79_007009 [Hemibagrus wyckioides]|uniref:Ig-like domain-containing protein n=1 Tax=Hemibagrus wyckioides TaxID=337641 RepID=A0A9D3SMJ4_9TELE|nr:uncharacterized protein LOC131357859 [Hemibagrus wyckioides]KAG7328835.1 hypothetical protein KOW79_007009 [Hemibagrus wyckioides]
MLYTDPRLKMLMWITAMLFSKTDSAEIKYVSQPDPLITADVGDNVTLHCFRVGQESTGAIVWYKQNIGHEPRVMITFQHEPNYEDDFRPPKFSIGRDKTNCHLKIANVEPSDEATYYCGRRKFLTVFGNGTFLSVKGNEDVNVMVWQRGVSDSVPAGASVTLQCSVLSESRAAELQVLWFRAAPPQSHPQIIYTHHNSSHQCESGSSTHTCVYTFTKNILSLNDTGTYYCAVALCGKIIFGNGTRIQLERSVDPAVICLAVALGVCVIVIFALIFALTYEGTNGDQHMDTVRLNQCSVTQKTLDQDCDIVEVNYAAVQFNERRATRGRVKKEQQNIVYSDVRGLSIS